MEPTKALITTIFILLAHHTHGFKTTTRLIHRDSIFSPFYNASETIFDRTKRATQSTLARHALLSSSSSLNGIEAGLVTDTTHGILFVNFSIGDPPVPQLAIMDTGSSLTWVKCAPCMPCMPSITLFDPANSKTYKPLPCTEDCRRCTEKRWSWSTKKCLFSINYLGGQHVLGVYATDQLTFRTSNNSTAVIPNVTFGCSSLVAGLGNNQDPRMTGVLGLGVGPKFKNLISDVGLKFSYCVSTLSDPTYPYNRLSFGDAVDLTGTRTPFFFNNGHYHLHLLNISLNWQTLNISDEVFRKMSKEGIMVDSGTEVMFLHEEAFEVVKAEVKKLGSSNLTETRSKSGLELCYKGLVNVDARDQFPNMDLQFKDGADLLIDNTGMFIQVDDNTFCLAVIRTKGVSIIGVMAQQGYNVGYDLKGSRIYFQDLDCQILEARKF
ncbi:Aspartic proteinase CDR1 [Linum perenne]